LYCLISNKVRRIKDSDLLRCDITTSVIRAGSKGNIEEEMVMVIMAAIMILTQ